MKEDMKKLLLSLNKKMGHRVFYFKKIFVKKKYLIRAK